MSEPIDPHQWSAPPPVEPTVPMLNEQPPDHRRWIIIGAVAAVAVGGIATALALSAGSSTGSSAHKPGPPLPVPAAIGPLQQRVDAVVDRYRASLARSAKSAQGELKRFLTDGQLAVYGDSGGSGLPEMVLVMGRSKDFPGIADATITNQAFGDLGTPEYLDAGPNGGTLQCSADTVSESPVKVCIWTDSTSTGVTIAVTTSISVDQLGHLTNTARDTIDG